MIFKFGKTRYSLLSTATSGGTLILAANAKQFQIFTGALNHTVRLPDATTTSNGQGIKFTVINESTGTITVQLNDTTTLTTLAAGESKDLLLTDDSTSNGVWRVASFAGAQGGGLGSVSPGSSITSNYAVQPTDSGRVLNIDTSSSAVTVTLPDPSDSGFLVTIKDLAGNSDINNITIARNASEKIDNVSDDLVLAQQYGAVSLISNGTDWTVVAGAILGAVSGNIGLFAGSSSETDDIEIVDLSNESDSTFFGNLTLGRSYSSGCGSSVRAVFGGGFNTSVNVNTIDYAEFDTLANAVDFGDLTVARNGLTSCSSKVRGLFAGGSDGTNKNEIDYITIATTGNAVDFGDLTVARAGLAGCASNVRGVFAGGNNAGGRNEIDYVTIATTGNAVDFGDLTVARNYNASCSSNIRGLFAGGSPAATPVISIDYITIATTGNAQNFEDLTVARDQLAAASSSVRGVFAGGYDSSGPTTYDTIDFVNIASLAEAQGFGNLTVAKSALAGCSNAHGGL